MIMIIVSGVLILIVIGFIVYFYLDMKKTNKELDTKFGGVQKMLDEHKEREKNAAEKAMDDLQAEMDKEKALKIARRIAGIYPNLKGAEALDLFERRFHDRIDKKERSTLLLDRSKVLYYSVYIGGKDIILLDRASKIGRDLLRDRDFCSNPHMRLVVEEHLRHIALEKRMMSEVG